MVTKTRKAIVFFDGDGTLWYPKKTGCTKHPVWIYQDKRYKNHVNHLIMIPSVFSTIKKLKKMGVITVILSTHPQVPKEADVILKHKVKHFKLVGLFDEVHATRGHHESKGEFILKILKERGIPKSKALMVGDSYRWDYKSAKDKGIDGLLIETVYENEKVNSKGVIKKLSDVLRFV